MINAHAPLAPSSAARWVACAGSVLLEALFPELGDGEDAREGNAAHWAASEILTGQLVALGQVAPNGVVLAEEMLEGADSYVAGIDAVLAKHGKTRADLHVEERVFIPYVSEHNYGTPDCWLYVPEAGILYVWDFKFGYRFIEVFENWQLIDYTCGILDRLNINGATDQHIDVVMSLAQPRAYHRDGAIREWKVKASALRPHFNILQMAAGAALSPDAKCTVNSECRDCRGRYACEANQREALDGVGLSYKSTPLELSAPALAKELRTLRRASETIKARLSGLEETATHRIKRGERVPGFAVEPQVGRQDWSAPIEQVIALGELVGVKLSKPGVITPKQAIKAGLDEATVTAMSGRTAKGLALVVDDGKAARKAFG